MGGKNPLGEVLVGRSSGWEKVRLAHNLVGRGSVGSLCH